MNAMIDWSNYEEYMLLLVDGELNAAEEKELLAFVSKHPELERELAAYRATKMQVDPELVFSGKEQLLKKESGAIIYLGQWRSYAVAAGIAALLFFGIFKWQQGTEEASVVKVNNTPNDTIIKKEEAPVKQESHTSLPVAVIKKETPVAKAFVQEYHKKIREPKRPTLQTNKAELKEELAQLSAFEIKEVVQGIPTQHEMNTVAMETRDTVATAPKKKNKFQRMWLRPEKGEGIQALAQAVSNTVQKAKKIGRDIKDTDVTVSIGDKELFVINL